MLLFISILSFSLTAGTPAVRNSNGGLEAGRGDAEVIRIRAHLDGALALMAAADTSGLTPSQRAARELNVARLRQYRDDGVFPRNRHFAGAYVPYFRDESGVLCAMAHLIEQSGGGAFVDDVARTRNNAFVRELAADPATASALAGWLASNGMTVEEAARVQPTYWGGSVTVDTPEQVLPVGACSAPVHFRVAHPDGGPFTGWAFAYEGTQQRLDVEFFADEACSILVPGNGFSEMFFVDGGVASYSFRSRNAGTTPVLTQVSNSYDSQTHTFTLADGGMPSDAGVKPPDGGAITATDGGAAVKPDAGIGPDDVGLVRDAGSADSGAPSSSTPAQPLGESGEDQRGGCASTGGAGSSAVALLVAFAARRRVGRRSTASLRS